MNQISRELESKHWFDFLSMLNIHLAFEIVDIWNVTKRIYVPTLINEQL